MHENLPEKKPTGISLNVIGDHEIIVGEKVSFTSSALISISGTRNSINIMDETDLGSTKITIRGRNISVIIGSKCKIKGPVIVAAGNGTKVSIGYGTSWESGSINAAEGQSVIIGSDCMFSNQIMIRNMDGHGLFDGKTRKRINEAKSVVIGNHVWIGNSARVNKGTIIEDGAVLGQMAIASGKLESYSLYAGIPARRLRQNVRWSRTFEYDDIPAEFRQECFDC